MPRSLSKGRFISAPRRLRLSKAMMVDEGKSCLKERAKFDPTKPAPPVISIFIWRYLTTDKSFTSRRKGGGCENDIHHLKLGCKIQKSGNPSICLPAPQARLGTQPDWYGQCSNHQQPPG